MAALAARSARLWPIGRGLTIAATMLALAGCNMLQYRHGPSPILQGSEVQAASANKLVLLRALAQDASIGGDRASDWYLIAEAGFNFIDDQCRAYFDELFFLDRRSERLKTGLVVADKTTAAILAVTGTTVPTMNIVAQAFGFAVNATDLIAGTYLYRLPPATTQGFVAKLQSAYRRGASKNRALIDSPTAAYHSIQRYLDLCLPPRIEAEIAKQINGTTARAVIGDDSTTIDIETATRSTPSVESTLIMPTTPAVRARILDRADERFVETPPLDQKIKKKVFDAFILGLQKALCVPKPDGATGAATTAAVRDYYFGVSGGAQAPAAPDLNDPTLRASLEDLVASVRDCKDFGFANALEVGLYGPRRGTNAAKNIADVKVGLGILLANRGLVVQQTSDGKFDKPVRDAIKALRNSNNGDIDVPMAKMIRDAEPAKKPAPAPQPGPTSPNPDTKKSP